MKAYNGRHQESAIHLLELDAKLNIDKKSAPGKTLNLLGAECVKLASWVQEKYKGKGSYSKEGLNFMHAVASYADADAKLMETIKSGGASLVEKTSKDLTPLLVACGVGNREAICWLMENGGRNDDEGTRDPIMHAIGKGINESVNCLIDYGVSVNREVKEGVSPLMFACSLGERTIAETLLDAGAVWNFDSKYRNSSLRELIRLDSPK